MRVDPTGTTVQPVIVDSGNITILSGNITLVQNGNVATIAPRSQTPFGNAVNVQIGPGDIISNIPVVMDFGQHQVHEGEAFHAQYVDTSLDTGTVKFGLTVPTYANTIQAPHLKIGVEIYNGSARYDLYEGSTFSSGGNVAVYNRNRNSASTAGMTIKSGVTSTDGTLIEVFSVEPVLGEPLKAKLAMNGYSSLTPFIV